MRTGQVLVKAERKRDEDENHHNCKRSSVRHGRRDVQRRGPFRAQRADLLFLWVELQREVRCQSRALRRQVRDRAQERAWLLRLDPTTPQVEVATIRPDLHSVSLNQVSAFIDRKST